MQDHLDTFLAFVDTETGGAGLPKFVTDEIDAFLACGILAHGFLRLSCDGCREEKLVAFSCKRRGICPSCGTRRMAEAAAHLVDHVIPKVPAHNKQGPRAGQKVLSLQFAPRRPARGGESSALCANAHGFSLHAGVRCAADDRQGLEQLCRYITRPAIANERLSVNPPGRWC